MALKITLNKGYVGEKPKTRANLQALGLRKIRQSVIKQDNEAVRGQILVVRHLVTVEEVAGE
ncbi:50S ribosomal protein L30 [Corynebacterium suedekumii]|mgnify:FL=1|uniref:Large ribosomal subunit protein uL30 n=1 Tax=Corynebacterium suedekumii TaxID=3049801 RepID=A0ABY8VPT4_9CORY|nr:50S ribosomal protein L30 [Corynebacterium suedekumii]WIM71337.1 50S ribosomal protein L30 [Corynebacterium suedekumii]WIM73446.1 50S ribosomal protein L30 [Corynebacterium suedekumii]